MNYNELVDIPNKEQLNALVALSRIVTETLGDSPENTTNLRTRMDMDWDNTETPAKFTVRFLLYCDSADVRELFRSMGATESVEALDEDDYYHKYLHVFRIGNVEFRIFDDSEEVM